MLNVAHCWVLDAITTASLLLLRCMKERSFIWIADTYNACVSATSPFSERMQSKNKRWLPRITPQGIAEYVVAVKQ